MFIERITSDNYRKKVLFILIFTTLVSSIALTGLNGSLQNIDEVLYARVSRETLEHHSWLIQYQDGEPWFHKSPMLFWWIMSSFKLFGVSDFSAKLPSALASIVTAFMILLISKKLFNSEKSGVIATFIYLTSLQVYASSHQVATDSLLVMYLSLTLFLLIRGATEKPSWLILCGVFNGMVFLTKSILGFVFPAVLLLYIIVEKKWRLLTYLVILIIISIGISAPYFIYIYHKLPGLFTESFLHVNLMQRFHSGGSLSVWSMLFRLPYGIAFYTAVLCLFTLPFTPGLFFLFYRRGEDPQLRDIIWNDRSKLVSLYFIVVLTGYSLLEGHWLHWSLPMIPIVSIFLGHTLNRTKNRNIHLAISGLALIVLLIFLYAFFTLKDQYPAYKDVVIGLIIIYILVVLVSLFLYFRRVTNEKGLFVLVAIFFLCFTINSAVTVPLDFNRDLKEFSRVIYNEPSPLVVISTNRVNEGGKTTATIWYLKMPSVQYNSLEEFRKAIGQIQKGTYLMFYKGYTEDLNRMFSSFKVLKEGRIWNLGLIIEK
jgi:4-amino-4-deoxy-L-arabinose transferase-like glycosyltransferase